MLVVHFVLGILRLNRPRRGRLARLCLIRTALGWVGALCMESMDLKDLN